MKLISYLKKNVMIIDIKDLSSSQKFHDKLTIDFFIQKDKYFTLYHSISDTITKNRWLMSASNLNVTVAGQNEVEQIMRIK